MANKEYDLTDRAILYVDIDNGNWGISPNIRSVHILELTDEERDAIEEGSDSERIEAVLAARKRRGY